MNKYLVTGHLKGVIPLYIEVEADSEDEAVELARSEYEKNHDMEITDEEIYCEKIK